MMMNSPTAAIYTPSQRDGFFHASMSCRKAEMVSNHAAVRMLKAAEKYRVATVGRAINKGKLACPECWIVSGYDAINDPIARLG